MTHANELLSDGIRVTGKLLEIRGIVLKVNRMSKFKEIQVKLVIDRI